MSTCVEIKGECIEILHLPKEERRAEAKRLYALGLTQPQIAKELGVSRGNISHLLNGR